MRRYIHQFVQTFFKEVSKARKQNKKNRRSVDFVNGKSPLKPEISSSNLGEEIQEVEYSKEIKRSNRLLMKKLSNPKFNEMISTKAVSDINILDFKGKQEFFKSAVNKLFFESSGKQKDSEESSKDLPESNTKIILDEPSLGWIKQPTSKLAANPVVETPARCKSIASSSIEYPDVPGWSSRKNSQVDRILEQKLKQIAVNEKTIEDKEKTIKSNHTVGSSSHDSKGCCETNTENIAVNCTTNNSLGSEKCDESAAQYTLEDICVKSHVSPHVDLNRKFEVNEKFSKPCIMDEDKSNESIIDKVNTQVLEEGNNNTFQTIETLKIVDKQQKAVKKSKKPDPQPKLVDGMKGKVTMDENMAGRCEESCCAVCSESVSTNSLANDSNMSPNIKTSATEHSLFKRNSAEEINEITTVKGEIMSKEYIETIQTCEKEPQREICCKLENPVCDSTLCHSNNVDLGETFSNNTITDKVNPNNNTFYTNLNANQSLVNETLSRQKTSVIENVKAQNVLTGNGKALRHSYNEISDVQKRNRSLETQSKGSKVLVQTALIQNKNSAFKIKQSKAIAQSPMGYSKNIIDLNRSIENKLDSSGSIKKTGDKINERFSRRDPDSRVKFLNTRSTPPKLSDVHKGSQLKIYQKGNDSNGIIVKNIPKDLMKSKRLVNRQLQKYKPKQKSRRIYSKILTEGNLKKNSSYNVWGNKQKTLVRRLKRVRSENLILDKDSNNTTIRKPNRSSVVEANAKILKKSQNKNIVSPNEKSVTTMKTPRELTKGIKLNKINSDIFLTENGQNYNPNLITNINLSSNDVSSLVKHKLKRIDHSPAKIKTEFDLTKSRKLHSKKEFCKPARLQMYGGRRNIHINSNLRTTHSQDTLKTFINDKNTEPNLATRSLMTVSKLHLYPINIQVRNIYTTGYLGRVKQLPSKKKTTIQKKGYKIKDKNQSVSTANESTANLSKGVKLGDQVLARIPNLLSKDEFIKMGSASPKYDKPECETKTKMENDDCMNALKDSCNASSSYLKTKNRSSKLIFSKSEGCLNKVSNNSREGNNTIDLNSPDQQFEEKPIKNSELELDMDSQNSQLPKENEDSIESPKWKSREDRLEKWKLEMKSNSKDENFEVPENINEPKPLEHNSINTEIVGGKVDKFKNTLYNETEKTETSVDLVNKSETEVNLSNNAIEYNIIQKDKKVYNSLETDMNAEQEINILPEDADTNIVQVTNKNHIEENIVKGWSTKRNENGPTNESTVKNEIKKDCEEKYGGKKECDSFETDLDIKQEVKLLPKDAVKNVIKVTNNTCTRKESPNEVHTVKKNGSSASKVNTFNRKSLLKYGKLLPKSQSSPVNNHLSETNKALDEKLKSLQTKYRDLKNKSVESNENSSRDLTRTSSVNRLCKESKNKSAVITKQNAILKSSKIIEKDNHSNTTSVNTNQVHGLNLQNTNSMVVQKGEKVNIQSEVEAKPGFSLKQLEQLEFPVTSIKTSSVEQIEFPTGGATNYVKNMNIKDYDSLSPKTSSSKKGLEDKINIKSTKEVSDKLLNHQLQPKLTVSPAISKNKKTLPHVVDKTIFPKSINSQKMSILSSITKSCDKVTGSRKIQKEGDKMQKIHENFFKDKKMLPHTMDNMNFPKSNNSKNITNMSDITKSYNKAKPSRKLQMEGDKVQTSHVSFGNTNINKVNVPNGLTVSKTSSSIHTSHSQNTVLTRQASGKSETPPLKCYNTNHNKSEQKTSTIYTKKRKRNPSSFIVDKKASQKRNPHQHSKKDSVDFNTKRQINERCNTLHEGLMKSSRLLKLISSKQGETPVIVSDKINPTNQRKLTLEAILKPPVLPTKLVDALNKIKRHSLSVEKNKRKIGSRKVSHPSRILKTQLARNEETDSSKDNNIRKHINGNFNLVGCCRSKPKTYKVIHPIEKEKYGITLLKTNENLLEKLFDANHFNQNLVPHKYLIKRYKSGKELAEQLQTENEKQLNTLMTSEIYKSKKSIQNKTL